MKLAVEGVVKNPMEDPKFMNLHTTSGVILKKKNGAIPLRYICLYDVIKVPCSVKIDRRLSLKHLALLSLKEKGQNYWGKRDSHKHVLYVPTFLRIPQKKR